MAGFPLARGHKAGAILGCGISFVPWKSVFIPNPLRLGGG
jgi:hypothetical protein